MKPVSGEELRRGILLFNRGEFFEAHEVLEDVWRGAPKEQKRFLQGVVQLAVAFHHYSTGNLVGMRSVMERGIKNMAGQAEGYCGIRLAPLLRSLAAWQEALETGRSLPPLPRIELHT